MRTISRSERRRPIKSLEQAVPRTALCLCLAFAGLASVPEWMAPPAYAACTPAAGNNVFAVCDGPTVNLGTNGTETNGYGNNDDDSLTVTILRGASVTGDGNGIAGRDDLTVINAGQIDGLGQGAGVTGAGVRAFQALTILENSGTIQGWTNAVASAFDIGLIINTGRIIAGIGGGLGAGVTSSSGSIGVLTNSGVVIGASDGVYALQNIETLTNSGSITGDGVGVRANSGYITALFNSGVISGSSDVGVRAAETIDWLENSGIIEGATNGITGTNGIGWVSNSGRITGQAGGGVTSADGSIDALHNVGIISGTEDGVYARDSIGTLTNSGFIGSGQIGIRAFSGSIDSILNTGTISGGSDDGIIASMHIGSITNSGTIRGDTFAIQEQGIGDTLLTLHAGSILIGRVDLGGGVNTLNIGEGLSLNSTFEETGDGLAALPQFGSLAGHLVAILDTPGGTNQRQVVAVDPSAFANLDDALATLTSGIGSVVQGRQAAVRSDPVLGFASRFAAADETSLATFSDLNLDGVLHLNPNRFWIEGFGVYRQDDSDRVGGEFDHLSGGLVAGVDVPLDAITSLGVMAGFAASTSENEIDTQSTDTTSYYAGVYASTQTGGIFWDASLTVGYTDYDQERITANNLVAGGLETASADFDGWFINPQVTATREAANPFAGSGFGALVASNTLQQSLTLSYAGLFLDGYTETGTTNPLSLDDRAIHVASARAALALPFEAIHADGALTTLRLIGGMEARTQFGDDGISGTLLGQGVITRLDDDDAAFGAFLGLSGEYQTTTGLTAYANTEALLDTNSAYQISATAGLRIAF